MLSKNIHAIFFTICIAMILIAPVNATQLESPPTLKTYIPSSPADDSRFFEQVSDLVMPYSGASLPRGTGLTQIQTFALLGSSYNIQDENTAQDLLSFLFYTGKAGEVYQQYLDAKRIGFTPIDTDETYNLAQEYYRTAKDVYQKCQGCSTYLPDFVMYSFPQQGTETERETYTSPTRLSPSDPSKPYDDEQFGALADLWLYVYLLSETEAGYVEGDSRGADPSVRILRGDGPAQAQQIYFTALEMNFSPEIHAYVSELASFFYAISQAGIEFAAFEGEKVLPTTITKGKPEYERAAGWYKAAQNALQRSELTQQGVELPVLIRFESALQLPRGYDQELYSALTPYLLTDEAKEAGFNLFS